MGTLTLGILFSSQAGNWGKVENDIKRLGVSSKDIEVTNTLIEGFCSIICRILYLLVEIGLIAQVDQHLRELVVSLRSCELYAGFLSNRLGLDFLV